MAQRESTLVQRMIQRVRRKYPRAYVRKLSDRYNRGLPDVLILYPRRPRPDCSSRFGVLFVEAKAAEGKLSEIQKEEHRQIESVAAGPCNVMVCKTAEEVERVLAFWGACL